MSATLNLDICRQCRSAFCSCRVPHVTPGQEVLAPFHTGRPAKGSWGSYARLVRVRVVRVEETPEGRFAVVEGRMGRRRVLVEGLRAIEGLVEGAEDRAAMGGRQ